jgi:hypothetical protein
MTDQTNILRLANTGLLLVIAIILFLIFRAMPRPAPTSADFELARSHHDTRRFRLLRSQLPGVTVENQVEITGDVGFSDPFVSINGPVSVESSKGDLHVTISDINLSKGVRLPGVRPRHDRQSTTSGSSDRSLT